jgi:hypothetical protein
LSIDSHIYDQIDQYLKGILSDQEMVDFEEKMQSDAALAEEVEMQKLLNDLILEKSLADIRKKVGQDFSDGAVSSGQGRIPWLPVAGMLLIASGIFLYFQYKNPATKIISRRVSEESLAADNPAAEIRLSGEKSDHSSPPGKIKENIQSGKKDSDFRTTSIQSEQIEYQTTDLELKTSEQEKLNIQDVVTPEKAVGNQNKNLDIPCPEIRFEVKSSPSCRNKETGTIQILISGIYGGEKPYRFSIAGNDFSGESLLSQLGAGNYITAVKDNRGCKTEKEVVVSQVTCPEYKDYSFNPETENWNIPLTGQESGNIKIADKNGTIVFSAKISNGSPGEWNGTSLQGEVLESGTYLYLIQTTEGEIRQGYISILH